MIQICKFLIEIFSQHFWCSILIFYWGLEVYEKDYISSCHILDWCGEILFAFPSTPLIIKVDHFSDMVWLGHRGFLCPQVSAPMSSEGWSRDNLKCFCVQMRSLSPLDFTSTLHALTVRLDEFSWAENYWFSNITSFKGKLNVLVWKSHLLSVIRPHFTSINFFKLHVSFCLKWEKLHNYSNCVQLTFRWHSIHISSQHKPND